MITSFGIFGESADQVFENIAHFHAINGFGIEVDLRKFLYHAIQTVVLVHLFDLLLEL